MFPELRGKLNGLAVRVPLTNASITDCVFEVGKPTTVEEVNALFADAAAEGPLAGGGSGGAAEPAGGATRRRL